MTTTELIKILKDNEHGGISHKPRELSLTINGKYMPNPQITLSSTGDGICGAEIDLDVDGEFYEEQEPKTDVPDMNVGRWIPVTNGRGGHECDQCHEYAPSYQSGDEYLSKHCPRCGAKMEG